MHSPKKFSAKWIFRVIIGKLKAFFFEAVIGLIAAALHRRHIKELECYQSGVSQKEYTRMFPPRIVDKTTFHDEPPNDPEFDHKVAHVQPQEVRDTYVYFMNSYKRQINISLL